MSHDGIGRMRPVLDSEFVPRSDETANLKAHIQTLQGRLEALERAVTAMREREIKVRRAVGQLGAAFDLTK